MANYPRIGTTGRKEKWVRKPETAPRCIAPHCTARATNQPELEVNWFRGDDERSGPVCKAHSTDPKLLFAWTSEWRAALAVKQLDAAARKAKSLMAQRDDGSPSSYEARPDQPKLPESGGVSSIVLGAEGEQ